MTAQELFEHLSEIPQDIREKAEVCGVVGNLPSTAKRVIIAAFKDGSGHMLIVNPMGTHLPEKFYNSVEFFELKA